jgi:predicted dehydrogenase
MRQFRSISEGLNDWQPTYVIIASPTSQHSTDLAVVLKEGFDGPVLVEKPLLTASKELTFKTRDHIYVGYNLRFLAVVGELKRLISDQNVLTANIWNAQFLPLWRPERDYRTTSSATRAMGGGVLRDLSHDLDLVSFLLGEIRSVSGLISNSNTLQINTEDSVHAIVTSAKCPSLSLYLSYLDRVARHEIRLTTARHSIQCDLLSGEISVNDVKSSWPTTRDETFKQMHRSILASDSTVVCSFAEGLTTVRCIEGLELSSQEGKTIFL